MLGKYLDLIKSHVLPDIKELWQKTKWENSTLMDHLYFQVHDKKKKKKHRVPRLYENTLNA